MPRASLRIATYALGWVLVGLSARAWAASLTSEFLLPETTRGYLSVRSVPQLNEQWKKTQLGQLMSDPVMKPFAEDLRRQLDERFNAVYDRLGLTLNDVQNVPSGELVVGLIQLSENEAARVCLMDVSGRLDKANDLMRRAQTNLTKRGATKKEASLSGAKVWVFNVPASGDDHDAKPHQTIYFLRENLLGAIDNLSAAEGIIARAAGAKSESLGSQLPFQQTMARCKKDAGNTVPLVRWYVQPLGYAEAVRAVTSEENRRRGKPLHKILRNQGFAALQGVGGFVNFSLDSYEMLHRTAVYAPPPYQKSTKMLVFPNVTDFGPQKWVPRDIATYTTLSIDILNAFDNFGPLYDELFGEGVSGAWDDVLQAFKVDPNGPRMDLRRDLITYLGKRVTVLTDYQLPITATSERLLYAIATSDEKALSSAISRWLRGDPTAKRREWKGFVIWEMVEPEVKHEIPTISLELPDEQPKRVVGARAPAGQERILPHAAVTVAHGHLFIASHMDFLQKVLVLPKERELLSRDLDYNLVTKTIKQLGLPQQCAQSFSRTDEEYRATYELVRQGKMPQSETMLARAINSLMGGEGKKNVTRKQRIEGSKLPEFEVVRRYLGPAGLAAESEANGWFVKGFVLKKQSQ